MAWYDVTYADGVKGRVQIYGPMKDRQRIADWYGTRLSPEGYKKQQEELREKEKQEAKQQSETKGLPKLQGSDKQVAWAETIRVEYINKVDDFINRTVSADVNKGDLNKAEYARYFQPINETTKQFRDQLLSKASASWWIDNRGKPLNVIYKEVSPELFDKHNKLNTEAREYLLKRSSNPETRLLEETQPAGEPSPAKEPEKPKPKPGTVSLEELKQAHTERNPASQMRDGILKHQVTIEHTNPAARRWLKDPGSMDILGVDSPKSVTKATRQPKPRMPKPPKAKSPASPKNKRVGKYYVSGGAVSRKPIGKRRR